MAAIILTPMFGLYYLIKFFWETFIEPPAPLIITNSSAYAHERQVKFAYKNIETILAYKFSYYQRLNSYDKAEFLKRISKFISDKEFRALGGLNLTEEMVVLISASAIQLTFGLEEYMLDHFHRIFIYPKEFYSRLNKEYHKGETNMAGVIVLSWKHFNEGYTVPNDNLNLGLHEMAHALRFDKFKSDDYDVFFSEYIDKWQLISKEEFKKLKNKESSFLRSYGGTNFSEFFSVCVEYFFESPKEFKSKLPEIYKHLCILLNQDPAANVTNFNTSVTYNNYKDLGTNVFSFKVSQKNRAAELLWMVCFFCIAGFLLSKGATENLGQLYFMSVLLVLSAVRRIVVSKEAIEMNTNGIRVISGIHTKFDAVFYYEKIVSVVFSKGEDKRSDNTIKINTIKNGKIKKSSFLYAFTTEDMKTMGNYFKEKKIPVKFDGFDIKSES